MPAVEASDVVFFFGAGASASFGIPTMKQFVTDFEEYLEDVATKDERLTYTSIKETLEKRMSSRKIDLEGVFTVIDGIIDYKSERLGLLSLYSATEFKKGFPNKHDIAICRLLRQKFQTFVREKCIIPEESFDKIRMVYHDFFNRFALELTGGRQTSGDYAWQNSWTIFTTNYDTCLEYYWREVVRAGIDTGFSFNQRRSVNVLKPARFLNQDIGLQLFKLHGSVNWLIEKGTGEVIEEEMVRGRSHMGRRFAGEMMVYPIAEKELYLDPYISMLLRLNRELEKKSVWVVIGYSFNDPIIREIFLKKSRRKHLILVHPQAYEVFVKRLSGMKGEVSAIDKKFGQEGIFRQVNHQITHKLVPNPKYRYVKTPIP